MNNFHRMQPTSKQQSSADPELSTVSLDLMQFADRNGTPGNQDSILCTNGQPWMHKLSAVKPSNSLLTKAKYNLRDAVAKLTRSSYVKQDGKGFDNPVNQIRNGLSVSEASLLTEIDDLPNPSDAESGRLVIDSIQNTGISQREQSRQFHCHINRRHATDNRPRNQLIAVSCFCLVFIVAELIGGVVSNSLALVSDATHLLGDLAGFLVSLFAIWIAKKPPTSRMSVGYHRAEILGALISILIIWAITAVLFYLAIKRIIDNSYRIDADTMLITAGLGVAFNIIMGLVLHSSVFACQIPHGHTHGVDPAPSHKQGSDTHSLIRLSDNTDPDRTLSEPNYHQLSVSTGKQRSSTNSPNDRQVKTSKMNINVKAAFVHIIGDLVQSVGVLIAAYIIRFKPEYKIADPICTFIFSIIVLITTVSVIKDALWIIMEGVPKSINYKVLKLSLASISGVRHVHSLHVSSLTTDKHVISVHLTINEETDYDKVLRESTEHLRTIYDFYLITVQIEKHQSAAISECEQCLN